MNDLDTLLAQIQQALMQRAAPVQSRQAQPQQEQLPQAMEQINVTGQRPPQEPPQDPLQMIMNSQQQMPGLGGLTGMPTPGLGPASYNPLYKQGGGYGADDFAKTKEFLKEPSIGALLGK